jgi:hypothetical protein
MAGSEAFAKATGRLRFSCYRDRMFDLSFAPKNQTERDLFNELMHYQRLFSTCHMALQRIASEGNPLDNIQQDARCTLEELTKMSDAHYGRAAREPVS